MTNDMKMAIRQITKIESKERETKSKICKEKESKAEMPTNTLFSPLLLSTLSEWIITNDVKKAMKEMLKIEGEKERER